MAVFLLVLLFLGQPQAPDPAAAGLKALESRNYDEAVRQFTQAVAADPKDYAAHFNLALAYSLMGRDQDAIAAYRKTLELKPGLYQAELNLGILLLRDKQPREALAHFEAARAAKPGEFRPRLLAADALYDAGEFERAGQAYAAAAAADPKSSAAELGLARSLLRLTHLAEAEPHFRRAAELDPAAREAVLELAEAFEQSGQAPQAAAIYAQFPERPEVQERLGQLLVQSGRPADAIQHLEAAVTRSPTPANRVALALAYRKAGQPDKTLAILEQATAAEPGNAELRMVYGRELRDQRKFAQAARQFSAVAQAQPGSAEAWSELSTMLVSLEEFPQALAALDRVAQLGAETPGHVYLRAIVLDRLRDRKGALSSYERFLAASGGKNPNEEFKARQRARILQRELEKR